MAEMKFDLLAQPPLKADAIAVADNEHHARGRNRNRRAIASGVT
jgi:hypothetical protein